MRLVMLIMFSILLLFPSYPAIAAGFNYNIQVVVNDKQVEFPDQKAFVDPGTDRTYVPLRFVSEKLGAGVEWNQYEKAAIIIKDGQTIKSLVGSKQPTINGAPVFLDAPVKLVNSRTVVPLRFMSEALGTNVEWNSTTKTVYIRTSNKPPGNNPGIDIPPGSTVEVTADALNVRSGPGVTKSVLGKVYQGDSLLVYNTVSDWCEVELLGGGTGWVSGEYVKPVNKEDVKNGDDDKKNENKEEDKDEDEDQRQDDGQALDPGNDIGGPSSVEFTLVDFDIEDRGRGSFATITAAQSGTGTRTGSVECKVFTLTAPDRVVVDLYGVEPGDVPENINVNGDLVSKVRIGHHSKNPSIVRLVFDVRQAVMFDLAEQKKKNGSELTLELFIPDLDTILRGKVIAIDPGHGGSEPGAVGATGLIEKDVNLAISRLASDLLRQNGARVVLTRSSDVNVGLYERTAVAAQAGADIFVSIHINASTNRSAGGISTYYRLHGDPGVSQADNLLLAQKVQAQLVKILGRRNIGVLQDNFAVLRSASMPAILVESLFISNPEEENLLKQDFYRAQIAEAVAKGIADYFMCKGAM